MKLTRREFLRLSGAAAGTVSLAGKKAEAGELDAFKGGVPWTQVTPSICPYCAVGCGIGVGTANGKVVNIEGDPDHPINQGSLCSKGATLKQLVNSDRRITKPMYRAPRTGEWRTVEWDWALDQIARRIKKTRDDTWTETDSRGLSYLTVRRTQRIASVGSAALDNEECSLLVKALRAMGLVYIEHQARI